MKRGWKREAAEWLAALAGSAMLWTMLFAAMMIAAPVK
jgi:hypothetical protein